MNHTCVTSMNDHILNHIGKFMIQSWDLYWPKPSNLKVYLEETNTDYKSQYINFVDWSSKCGNNFKDFSVYCKDARAKRFAKKGFTFIDAMENIDTKYLIWLDADLLFHKQFNESLINNLLPENKLIGFFDTFYQSMPDRTYTQEQYLDRTERKKFAAESGFVIINTQHKLFEQYKENYKNLYFSPKIHESLTHWFDGEVCASAARDILEHVQDLSSLRMTNKTQTPLNRSHLSEYFTHQKGKSKTKHSQKDFKRIINVKI